MSFDVQKLKSENNIIDIVGRTVSLKKTGSEFYGVCPFHDDHKTSLQVNDSKQIYSCFVCDYSGDVLDYLQKFGHTFQEACKILSGEDVTGDFKPVQNQIKRPIPQKDKWSYLGGQKNEPLSFKHYSMGEPSDKWAYKNADGLIMGYVCRFNLDGGEKQVIPFSFCTDGTRSEWRWKGISGSRPLYNLDKLKTYPDASILLVEGEKTADAGQKELNPEKTIVMTWIGGANGVDKTDFSVLKDRVVIYLPDHDTEQRFGDKHPKAGELKPENEQSGNAAMLAIYEKLKDIARLNRWVYVPENFPHKWDVADRKEWGNDELKEWIIEKMGDVPIYEIKTEKPEFVKPVEITKPKEPINTPEVFAEKGTHKNPSIPQKNKKKRAPSENEHFRILGYESDENLKLEYYFFSHRAKKVVKFSPSSMTKANLMQIAPINYWERRFAGAKSKVDLDAAQHFLIDSCHNVGPFDAEKIRGRGAWIDDGKMLIHTGSELLIGDERIPIKEYSSEYVYQIGADLGFGEGTPLKTSQTGVLIEKIKWLSWEREIDAYLLAGWCVVAPFCGVLNWRSHIWITGSAGTGKSWVMENMVRRLLGSICVAVQGKTTEAGVRGILQSDARPVLFDEADVDNYADKERIQNVLALARAASSSDGGEIAKGTQSGGSRTFVTRACFAFSSIGVQLNQQSDRSRFSTLSLKRFETEDGDDGFSGFHKDWDDLVDAEFVDALQARTIKLMPVILKNAEMFSKAASHEIKSQRTGDQIGIMLSGAYSLMSSNLISYDDAVKFVKSKDWEEEKGIQLTKDELQLFSILSGEPVRIEGEMSTYERSIGELVMIASGKHYDFRLDIGSVIDLLKRYGILVKKERVLFSNNSPRIRKIIGQTAWANNHGRILERLDGAKKETARTYYPGHSSRGVSIPLDLFADGFEVVPPPGAAKLTNPTPHDYTSAANQTLQQGRIKY